MSPYCFYGSTRKVGQKEFIGKTDTYDIKLAKNETEACQIVVRSMTGAASDKFRLEFSDFVNEQGEKLRFISRFFRMPQQGRVHIKCG